MKFYVRFGDAPPLVLSKPEIYQRIQTGAAAQDTLSCPVGASEWSTLGKLVPEMFETGASSPGNGVADIVGKAGSFIAEHGGEVVNLAPLFARRILVSNFTSEHASPQERQQLEAAEIPVRSPVAQNYAAWRRAMLWFSGIGLGLAAIIQFFGALGEMFGSRVPGALRLLSFGMVASQIAAAALVLLSAIRWTRLRYSRKRARWGWFCGFFGPLLLFLIPLAAISENRDWLGYFNAQQDPANAMSAADIDQLANSAQFASGMSQVMLITFAAFGVIILVPRIFGLFPGIIRACLTMRTLVPEADLPGYVAAIIAPLYGILLLVIMSFAAQLQSGPLFIGLLAMLATPILVLKNARDLSRPMDAEEMNKHLKSLRTKTSISTSIGILFVLVAMGPYWKHIEWHSVFSILGQLVGNIFLLTIVGADFLLGLMKLSFDQDEAISGSPLYTNMQQRYADLSQVRLTQFVDDLPAPPPAAAVNATEASS